MIYNFVCIMEFEPVPFVKLNLIVALTLAILSLGSHLPASAALDALPGASAIPPAAGVAAAAAPSPTPNLAPCISWRNPKMAPRFAILCVHGLGLNSNSYSNFGQHMARFGAIVYAIDVRGFGSWMNAKGQKDMDFQGCLDDIQAALKEIHIAHPGLPVYLLGESMGGAIALRGASQFPTLIDGVISAVPAAERFKEKRTDLKVGMQFLTGPRRQRESIGKEVVMQAATDRQSNVVNEKLAQAWQDDPNNRLDLSPKDLMQFQKFMDDNKEAVKKLTVPVLFLQGLDDDLVRPDGTWDLAKQVGVHDRTLVALPARHLMIEEAQDASDPLVANAAWHHVLGWVLTRLPEHAPTAAEAPLRKISDATAAAVTQGAPTVVTFYAKWCDQCDKISAFVDKAQPVKGLRVRFVKYDVDDRSNDALVKEFAVGAIPQLIFLKPDGTINSSLMGQPGAPTILQNVVDLLRAE
jgi:acylglycerol lipase